MNQLNTICRKFLHLGLKTETSRFDKATRD